MTLNEIIENFNTTPFLFIGSGMTRRYMNLPSWRGLLEHFSNIVNADPFSYSAYENRARSEKQPMGLYPKVAELIQRDFDAKWFSDPSIRTVNDDVMEEIKRGLSPFKAEIAAYITSESEINDIYREEIKKLIEISEKSIAGIITTNYDSFLEDAFVGFKKYVGQTELIFSPIQGLAEIYKIHGSVESPETIIINEKDYCNFESKSAYLAAKLLTIFLEYPIVFMGYSITDSNILSIIRSISTCLDDKQLEKLEGRFVFVEYKRGLKTPEVSSYTVMEEDKPLKMTKISLEDFTPLYEAIGGKRSTIPVRILRKFKKELYDFTITNNPTTHLHVASIDDSRIGDDDLVLSIGKLSTMGLQGLQGISSNDWFSDIVLDTISFSANDLLEYAFPVLLKQNSSKLPIFKHLSKATKEFPECAKYAESINFEKLISNTIRKGRARLVDYHGVKEIWNAEKENLEKATLLIAHLTEEKINVNELEAVLKEIFEEDAHVLAKASPSTRTNLRRLIMIYDYLKWGK